MFELALQLGRTVAELEQSISWRELLGWNDFFADRADEMTRTPGGRDEPETDLAGMSPHQVAAAFGANIARR